jgi:DnaJ-domain-containing protein 1
MERSTTNTVKHWLREQLKALAQVQRCMAGQPGVGAAPVREIDLAVYTWSGMMIHVHLLDEALKPPRVRRLLESATAVGIPTLLLLDERLLPRQGERAPLERWFVPLPAIANDRVYTYRLDGGSPVIRTVHFPAVSRLEVEARYGPAVFISQLRYFRQTVKHPALKGYWLVADFEPEAAGKNPVSNPRDHGRQPPPPAQQTRLENQPPAPSPKTRLEASYELLGVSRGDSLEDVKAAFRRLVFEVHPDVSRLPKEEAEARFKALNEAYEYIRTKTAPE